MQEGQAAPSQVTNNVQIHQDLRSTNSEELLSEGEKEQVVATAEDLEVARGDAAMPIIWSLSVAQKLIVEGKEVAVDAVAMQPTGQIFSAQQPIPASNWGQA